MEHEPDGAIGVLTGGPAGLTRRRRFVMVCHYSSLAEDRDTKIPVGNDRQPMWVMSIVCAMCDKVRSLMLERLCSCAMPQGTELDFFWLRKHM